MAREAIEWTTKELDDDHKDYLRTLPYVYEFDDCMIVHASPDNPKRWNYILSLEDAAQGFEAFEQQICFVGHSHTPWVIAMGPNGHMHVRQDYPVEIQEGHRYLINVGSVGQPRDRNPAAAFGVFDEDQRKYSLVRSQYDITTTQEKIRTNGLPEFLADRLANGQ